MTMSDTLIEVDSDRVTQSLHDAGKKLDGGIGEMFLDFSAVQRIDPSAIVALESLARAADSKHVKLALRGVNIDIYKVLKLVKLGSRFVLQNQN